MFIKLDIRKNPTAPINIAEVTEEAGKLVIGKANILIIIESTEVVIKQESLMSLHWRLLPQKATNKTYNNTRIPRIKVKYNNVVTDVIRPL